MHISYSTILRISIPLKELKLKLALETELFFFFFSVFLSFLQIRLVFVGSRKKRGNPIVH